MTSRHQVRRRAEAVYTGPHGWSAGVSGYRRWTAIGEHDGAVHTGFAVCELEPGAVLPAHVHSFEETFHILDGTAVVHTTEGAFRVGPGDYGLVPVGVAHSWRGVGDTVVRWAEMQGPQPRERHDDDTFRVPPLPDHEPVPVDVRDPRTRSLGTITPAHMSVANQSQSMLAVSASMRTALLVYSGITVKMMVDSDLGAQLTSMFMVQYDPEGYIGPHDHPFEETYLILDGTVEADFDGEHYVLEPGDVAWAGVGCVHAFTSVGTSRVRWLETQSPQPPPRHSYRFARDWNYLADRLGEQALAEGSRP